MKDKNTHDRYISFALFAGAFLFGFHFINEGLFHYDSVVLAKAVEDTYRTGHLHPSVGGRYGIVIINAILYLPFYLLGQNADFLTRLSSVLFYALSIPAFFIFINDLFKDRVQGFFAAVLLAFTPFYLGPSTYGKEHGMCVSFFLCSMVLVNRGAQQKRPLTLFLASLSYLAALSIRESALFMLPFYCWFYFKEKLNGRLLFAFTLPLVISIGFMMFTYLGPMIHDAITSDDLAVSHFCGLISKNLFIAFKEVWQSFPACYFILAALGILMVWRARHYFLLCFFLAWACLIFLYGNLDGYTLRHLDITILALHVFVSFGLAWVFRRSRVTAIGIFAVLVTVQLVRMYPVLEFRHHYDGSLRLGAFARSISAPNAVFITIDQTPFIQYYAERKTICYPLEHWEDLDSFLQEIEGLLDRKIPVYVIPTSRNYLLGGTAEKSKFLEIGPHGAGILSQLINKGVLRDVSSTEVSFQINNEVKTNLIREISKGDYDKIRGILLQASDQWKIKFLERFKFTDMGNVLYEDFHHPELSLDLYKMSIYKLGYFSFTGDEFTAKRPASGLLKAVIHDAGILMPAGKNDIEKLNNILKIKDLYKRFPNLKLIPRTPNSIKEGIRLTENDIIKRNRFLLEIVYPQQCPRSQPQKFIFID